MPVRALSRRLHQLGPLTSGGVEFLCRAPFSPKRAASTASALPSTSNTPGPVKKNAYDPPPLPISPLMDPSKYIPMSRRHPAKPQRPRGHETLTPQEEALKTNPYARILATDVRNDADFHRRLPSWFLIRFTMLRHPETDDIYLVPDRIREDSEGRQTLAQGRWAINNIELFDLLEKKKTWRKLVGGYEIDAKKIIWGKNMADHVLGLLRERVCVEMEKLVWREIVEMPWDGDGVGCVLDWGKNDGKDGKKECLIAVKGKATPLHHMRTLLGEEMATELQAKMKIPEEIVRTGILFHERSLKAQMWLMRIRAYLCIC